jgi:hypothetical protein
VETWWAIGSMDLLVFISWQLFLADFYVQAANKNFCRHSRQRSQQIFSINGSLLNMFPAMLGVLPRRSLILLGLFLNDRHYR